MGEDDVVFDGGYSVPSGIYNRLFDYQKTGRFLLIWLSSLLVVSTSAGVKARSLLLRRSVVSIQLTEALLGWR